MAHRTGLPYRTPESPDALTVLSRRMESRLGCAGIEDMTPEKNLAGLLCLVRLPRSLLKKVAILSLLTLSASETSSGQIENLPFEHLSVEQGLPVPNAYSMFQDRDGFIWVGTPAGLCRYDGYTFKVYDNAPLYAGSMIHQDRNGYIWYTPWGAIHRFDPTNGKTTRYPGGRLIRAEQILEGASGDIWVNTLGNGLARYVPSGDSVVFYKHEPRNTSSLCNDTVFALCEDSRGDLWVGTTHGLDRFDRKSGSFVHHEQVWGDAVWSILEDEEHTLWIGTREGLCKIEPATGRFDRFRNKGDQSNSVAFSLYLSRQRELWLVIGRRIARFDRSTRQFKFMKGSDTDTTISPGGYPFNHFLEDRRGRLWVSTSGGLALLDRTNDVFHVFKRRPDDPHSMWEGRVAAMMEDRTGRLWIGTENEGLNVVDETRDAFVHIAQHAYDKIQLSHKNVSALLEDSAGILWIGSHHGVDRLELPTGIKTHYAGDPKGTSRLLGTRVNRFVEDGPGGLWIATSWGLCHLDRTTGTISGFPPHPEEAGLWAEPEIMSICIDRGGTMWLGGGTASGLLMRFDRARRKFTNYYFVQYPEYSGTSSYPIGSLYEDKYGVLWFMGVELDAFDRTTGQVKRYPAGDTMSLGGASIGSFCEDAAGNFWTGSAYGLQHFDRATGTYGPLLAADKLAGSYVLDILEDNSGLSRGVGHPGNLWLLTERGISRYVPATGAMSNYGHEEGVPITASDFVHAAFKNRDGYIYFGGTNGFVKFHPDSVRDNTVVPPVFITSFKKFNVEAELDSAITAKKSIELSYDENVLSFEFAALNYVRPEKNQYAYKLEGFDREWVFCGTRRTTMYTNLDPGSYVFRVKGSNNDGVWNEEGASVAITIMPPPWKTVWAYLAYVFAAGGVLWGIRRYQINKLKARHQLELTQLEANTLREVDQMKSRFFANISHEFRTPLTLILGPAESLASKAGNENMKQGLGIIRRNASRLLTLVNQLLDLSQLEAQRMGLHTSALDISELVRGIAASFESLAAQKNIRFSVEAGEPVRGPFDPDVVEKIVVNLLSNAFKFSREGGTIAVTVRLTPAKETAGRPPASLPSKEEGRGANPPPLWQGGELVEILVSDTGIGIPPDQLEKIFDRFYQVDHAQTREHEGSGIGLALTKELVHLHGGEITVSSEVGQGSTFKVTLPLEVAQQGMEEFRRAPSASAPVQHELDARLLPDEHDIEKAEETGGQTEGSPVVLIIEDNADMRSYMRGQIQEVYSVVEAVDGLEGVEKAVECMPDLIISDVMMPKLDGMEVCKRLKEDLRTSHIPIILLTAKAGTQQRIEGFHTGADDYLVKPFDAKELLARIANLIEQRRRLRERFRSEVILQPQEVKITPVDEKFLKQLLDLVEAHMADSAFDTEAMAQALFMSRMQLHRKLKALVGHSPHEFLRAMRLHRAAQLLGKRAGNVSEIAFSVGFNNLSHFAKAFREEFGKAPSEYLETPPEKST